MSIGFGGTVVVLLYILNKNFNNRYIGNAMVSSQTQQELTKRLPQCHQSDAFGQELRCVASRIGKSTATNAESLAPCGAIGSHASYHA
jgi:hypothetical protein